MIMGKPRKSFPEVIQPKELPWWKMAKTPCSQWRGGVQVQPLARKLNHLDIPQLEILCAAARARHSQIHK